MLLSFVVVARGIGAVRRLPPLLVPSDSVPAEAHGVFWWCRSCRRRAVGRHPRLMRDRSVSRTATRRSQGARRRSGSRGSGPASGRVSRERLPARVLPPPRRRRHATSAISIQPDRCSAATASDPRRDVEHLSDEQARAFVKHGPAGLRVARWQYLCRRPRGRSGFQVRRPRRNRRRRRTLLRLLPAPVPIAAAQPGGDLSTDISGLLGPQLVVSTRRVWRRRVSYRRSCRPSVTHCIARHR